MTIDEFEPEDVLLEISRKFSNVSIFEKPSFGETIDRDSLPTIAYMLYSSDKNQIKGTIRIIRRYLTQGHSDEQCVNDILSLNILPRIKELVEFDSDSSIKFECAWIVTNIAAGTTEQTNAIISAGFVDLLLSCVADISSTMEIRAQVAWALGNVAGESPIYREELMKKGFTDAIAEILMQIYNDEACDVSSSLDGSVRLMNEYQYGNVEALIWALANMSRGGFYVAEYYKSYLPIFDVFSKYLMFDHTKLQIEVCWGLSRILYNMHEVVQFHTLNEITDQLCERLAYLLRIGTPKLVVPVIRTLVNITSGPNSSMTGLLRAPLLTSITRLLEPQAPSELRKDAYLVISNLAAGNEDTIRYVVNNKLVMVNVVAHITVPGHAYTANPPVWTPTISHAYYSRTEEWKVTKECLWIIFNIISSGSDAVVWRFVGDYDHLSYALAALLSYVDLPRDVCIKTIESIISLVQRSNKWVDQQRYADGKNPYVTAFLQSNVHEMLPMVQQHLYQNDYLRDSCLKLYKLLALSNESVVQVTSISEGNMGFDAASAFGLPTMTEIKSKSTKRRVLRGYEDGDLRLIESAVGNLCI